MFNRDLHQINAFAHQHTIHPGALAWPEQFSEEELRFVSRVVFGDEEHQQAAIVYVTKELAQLAEIERHVSAVMARVLSELQAEGAGLNAGFELNHALSCFAAEELLHATMFYRYVRLVSGRDFKYPDNLFAERVGLYHGTDSPYVKLAALCCSAYIGESVITVFERRTAMLDPERRFFLTQMLHAHGLDEARHVQFDHFVFEKVVPSLSLLEMRRMRQVLDATETLNTELARRFEMHAKQAFGVDYTKDNPAHRTQIELTMAFRSVVFGGELIRKVDDALSSEQRQLIASFSFEPYVHDGQRAPSAIEA